MLRVAITYVHAYPLGMATMSTKLVVTSVVPDWRIEDRLRRAREHSGLDQTELADQMGVSRATISNYERGITNSRRPIIVAWAMATGVDVNWLLGEDPGGSASAPAPATVPEYTNVPAQHVDKDGGCDCGSAPSGTRTPNPVI